MSSQELFLGATSAKAKRFFFKLRALQLLMSNKCLATGITGMRHLPTRSNREAWALEKEVRDLISQVVKERDGVAVHDKDLLQMVPEGA